MNLMEDFLEKNPHYRPTWWQCLKAKFKKSLREFLGINNDIREIEADIEILYEKFEGDTSEVAVGVDMKTMQNLVHEALKEEPITPEVPASKEE